MPLIKSGSRSAVSQNISEMVHAGHPQRQAVAAALRNAREYGGKFADGGSVGGNYAARQVLHQGFLHSPVPGRTDKLPISVAGGAYVLPADHVAALGQGNSLSGASIVSKMFKTGPYGAPPPSLKGTGAKIPHLNLRAPNPAKPGKTGFADGGSTGKPVPIIAAGGEIVLTPEQIIKKFGSLDAGHKALDAWVVRTRKKHIKTLRGLKPPRKD